MPLAEQHPPVGPSAGLYVHIPLCRTKCPYCSFHSHRAEPGDGIRLAEALLAHLRLLAQEPQIQALRFTTIFFGGGTPSLLQPALLSELLHACRSQLNCLIDAETSIEINPGTVDARSLEELRRAGFNRLSVGVQSFHDQELARLGRSHSAREAELVCTWARRAGFDSLNLDLMYGLPGQSPADWRSSLEKALSLGVDHLSLYELSVEAGTPFHRTLADGVLQLPSEERVLTMMACSAALTRAHGLVRYEISNYARCGFFCRHNLGYWHNGIYLGLGPGAVSSIAGRRYRIPPGIERYHRLAVHGQQVWHEEEELDREAAFRESVIMGLRMLRGVSAGRLRRRYRLDLHTHYGPVLERLVAQGLLRWRGERLSLTARGLPLANQVMAELV